MTQSSLIARLREYEKALEFNRVEYADYMLLNNLGDPTTQHGYKMAVAALTDLRDLIREAEGQEDVTRIEDWPLKDGNLRPLYTALGEKP